MTMLAQVNEEFPEYDPNLNYGYEESWFVGIGSSFLSLTYTAFMIWMLVDCLRKDPDRFLWMWLILFLPPFGPFIYFVVRWAPSNQFSSPKGLRRWTRAGEINRLTVAAKQIGNAHQFVQLGDALCETGKYERAGKSFAAALEKDPENLQALWGAAQVFQKFKNHSAAAEHLKKVLAIDPQYKFGDVSLAYGVSLYELKQVDDAEKHLTQHIKRWRHPQALYLLATIEAQRGNYDEARAHAEAMLIDIAGSPKAIARKFGRWKSLARRLLRKLPPSRTGG